MERRERTCTDPEPSIGGKDCSGEPVEYRLCNKLPCTEPKNGAWASWGSWGNCSATCDFGMERRERTCTDPEPSTGGKDCSGEPVEYRLCNKQPCAEPINGEWTSWGSWGNCSATCDFGMERRERTCTDPEPSTGGKDCSGEPVEYRLCNKQPCAVIHGNWSDWSSWGSCSATCDFGTELRIRSCTKPKPGLGGDYCAGEPVEYRTCRKASCRAVVSSFVVDQPRIRINSRLTFSRTLFQQGSDFNASTGTFTCSVPGTYLFSVNLVKMRSTVRVDLVACTLYKQDTVNQQEYIAHVFVDPTDDDTDKGSAAVSSTVVISLKLGEYVYLSGCSDPVTNMESRSTFTGVLLHPN